jgi:hypothetical protein
VWLISGTISAARSVSAFAVGCIGSNPPTVRNDALRPIRDEGHRATRQSTAQYAQVAKIDLHFIFAIQSMKVRRRMFPPEHLYHDSIKTLTVGMLSLSLLDETIPSRALHLESHFL